MNHVLARENDYQSTTMNYVLEYKGYQGFISYCTNDGVIGGRIESIPNLVIFEVNSVQQLEQEFEIAVDCYLEFCQEESLISARKPLH
jgi:predicted HicB family RNase H-like nuclease